MIKKLKMDPVKLHQYYRMSTGEFEVTATYTGSPGEFFPAV